MSVMLSMKRTALKLQTMAPRARGTAPVGREPTRVAFPTSLLLVALLASGCAPESGEIGASTEALSGSAACSDLATTESQTCAICRGRVLCWPGRTGTPTTTTLPLLPYEHAVEIFGGGETYCALTDLDGLICWGDNRSGQISPTAGATLTPRRIAPFEGAHVSGVSMVRDATGAQELLAMTWDPATWTASIYRQGNRMPWSVMPRSWQFMEHDAQGAAGLIRIEHLSWTDVPSAAVTSVSGTNEVGVLPALRAIDVATIGDTLYVLGSDAGEVQVLRRYPGTTVYLDDFMDTRMQSIRGRAGRLADIAGGAQAKARPAHLCAIVEATPARGRYVLCADGTTAAEIAGIPSSVATIHAGGFHHCALADGVPYCWNDGVTTATRLVVPSITSVPTTLGI